MKYQTTQKAVKAGHKHVIKVGYCALQAMLSMEQVQAYTVRREGWAADVYSIGNVAIATGYAPFGDVQPDYDTVLAWESRAKDIRAQYINNIDNYKICKQALRQLLADFVAEVCK